MALPQTVGSDAWVSAHDPTDDAGSNEVSTADQGSVSSGAASAATEPDPFDDLGHKRRWGWLWILVVLAAVGVGVGLYVRNARKPTAPRYLTARVTRGDIVEKIEATGTVQPITQVQVSSQVSGRVRAIHVDFNSHVHSGDLLAELDPEPFEAAVGVARAALASATAGLTRARVEVALQERNLTRAQEMRSRNLNAQSDVDAVLAARDASRAQVAVSQAEVARARAQVDQAETNRRYARIYAPIDGVVITRAVDQGQTVAASFQAPVLFLIANDLARMQILADIDEADVGRLHEGLSVDARVEAYPGERFRGTLRSLRYGSTNTAGVVTYPAVIEVVNEELKLRPGMTATVTVVTNRRTGVLRVPNAALRFRPSSPSGGPSAGAWRGRGGSGASAGVEPSASSEEEPSASAGPRSGRLFVLRNGQAARVRVRIGATDGTYTEVEGEGLDVDTEVITEQLEDTPRSGASASGGNRSGGSGSGGGRPPRMF